MIRSIILATALIAMSASAQQASPRNPQVDFPAYRSLTAEVGDHRVHRLLAWDDWKRASRKRHALILDARSADAFARGHIAGAVNLPFTDFTAESLATAIGADRNRPILIYCNNNFSNDLAPVRLKAVALALNVQTFVNLYGYGYRNVWELDDVVDFTDAKVGWVSSRTAER